MGRRESPAKTKARAKRPAQKKPRKNEASRLHALEKSLSEALEQQAAAAEILRVISRSPADVQPVLDTIAQSAARLCGGEFCHVFRFDGKLLHFAAHQGLTSAAFEVGRRLYPMPPGRGTAAARSILSGAVEEISDVQADREYAHGPFAKAVKYRSIVAVPMLRDGVAIGAIAVARARKGRFPRRQIELFRIFADQAVIAIENVRLFNETKEALERQTATSEILRVISQSPRDVQPVFDAIAERAATLCGAKFAFVTTFDGEWIHLRATYGPGTEEHRALYPVRPGRDSGAARIVLDRAPVQIPDFFADADYAHKDGARRMGIRSGFGAPMMRNGQVLGAIMVARPETGLIPDKLSQLLQTFADQAVIAIENVRLFTELDKRNRDLTEALEQQTATSEILRVISRSPTDVQPVFDTIADAALNLCRAGSAAVFTFDGEFIHLAAIASLDPKEAEAMRKVFPRLPSRDTAAARTILTRHPVIIPDVLEDPDFKIGPTAVATGFRSILSIPLLRDGNPIGVIGVGRSDPGPFADTQIELLKTFADQALIAIENVRLFTELDKRNRDLTEALEQQTATSEILRVISQSPTDVQPVFETIASAALKLCAASAATVTTFDGSLVRMAAIANVDPAGTEALRRQFPRPASRDTAATRAILTRSVAMIPDVLEDPDFGIQSAAVASGFRGALGVPLLREGTPIGAIAVGRLEPGRFPDTQIALLQTFADQAVIAIENVRLFKELEARNRDLTEALEHQTATSEILRVISSSPTDVQPVFEVIGERAEKLCDAEISVVTRVEDGEIHLAALHGVAGEGREAIKRYFPMPVSAETVTARAVRARDVVHVADYLADPRLVKDAAIAAGYRACLAVPMAREGQIIGVIFVARTKPGHFPDSKVALLQTFADQAVIAIENVRLFKELEVRNRDLTEALEQQTATSEILRVISRSPTEVQPVFDSIAKAAQELCRATSANVFTYDGEVVRVAAMANPNPDYAEAMHKVYPRPPSRDAAVLRAIQDRSVAMIPDVLEDPDYIRVIGVHATSGGFRSVLAVPLMREGQAIGGIAVGRAEPGAFPEAQVALLKTFAAQAVIAIENVRLFNELNARTAQLTSSVAELKALGEVGQAVSSTLDLGTVLRTIVSRAVQLAGMDGGSIWEYDEAREEFHLHATDRLPDELVEALRATPIRKGEGALGRMAVTGEPVEIRDVADERTYQSRMREVILRCGYHGVLTIPLLRENNLLGALAVNRKTPGAFDPQVIDLLKTFAAQSALAIQNARLFREIEDKSRQLEIASRHKSEFLANMSHELRTPLNAIIGFSEVLAERMFGEVNEKQAEYLSDILESGRHLLGLINDILDLSKIEAGRMELERTDFDLPGAIENTLILVRERAQRRGIKLERSVERGIGTIHADERKVKQVLLNLLSNALKFTPEGGRIDVRARIEDSVAEISVADTGVGIAPEDQQAVFEEFRQVGIASKKVEGTGLGLAISRKFIELHGGRIWVESKVGAGSKFSFTLPLTSVEKRAKG